MPHKFCNMSNCYLLISISCTQNDLFLGIFVFRGLVCIWIPGATFFSSWHWLGILAGNWLAASFSDVGKDQLVRGRQVVEIKHTLKEPRALTDPVGTAGYTAELHLRDACWRQANGEPQNCLPLQRADLLASLSASLIGQHLRKCFKVQ